jgi:hypothetical protein
LFNVQVTEAKLQQPQQINIFMDKLNSGTCLLSKLSILRLHDEDVSTVPSQPTTPTKPSYKKEQYLQKKKKE